MEKREVGRRYVSGLECVKDMCVRAFVLLCSGDKERRKEEERKFYQPEWIPL